MRAAMVLGAGFFALTFTGTAWASSAFVSGDHLSAGGASVGRCDTNGVQFSFPVEAAQGGSGYVVKSVELTDVSQACSGGTISIALTNTQGTVLSELSRITLIVEQDGKVTLPLNPKPPSTSVQAVYAVVQR